MYSLLALSLLQWKSKSKTAVVEGEDDMNSEEEIAVEDAQRELGIRPRVEMDAVYREVLTPLSDHFSGLRYAVPCHCIKDKSATSMRGIHLAVYMLSHNHTHQS